MKQPIEKQTVACWGLNKSVQSWLLHPTNEEEVLECLQFAGQKKLSICPKGSGNSFGDVFLIRDHISLDITGFNKIKNFDPATGIIIVEPGVLLSEILGIVMPYKWFLVAVSGSIHTTVGGAIASNIHGKDSWKEGNFSNNIVSFKLLLADGSVRQVERAADAELFNCVVGGLGLIGVIIEATLQLKKISSLMLACETKRACDFEEIEKHLYDNPNSNFVHSWIDAFANGKSTIKGITEVAIFAEGEDYPVEKFQKSLVSKTKIMMLSPEMFWRVFRVVWNPVFLHFLNSAKYNLSSLSPSRKKVVPFSRYQYPWAALPKSNLSSAPAGFMELQNLFPKQNAIKAFTELLHICKQFGRIPEVCGIKRFTKDAPYLSFSDDGLSISIDFTLNNFPEKKLEAFRQKLTETTLKYSGKTYLAKYPYMPQDAFKEMYPMYWKFKEVKTKYDPNRLFWSDAAERLLI